MDKETLLEMDREKRYLKRYRRNAALVDRLKNKLRDLDQRIYTLRSPTVSDMPRGGVPIMIDDLVADKADLEERIKRLTSKGRDLKTEITALIDSLDDVRYAEILEAFFIDCMDFDEIANEMGYTERHVIRLYSEGILALMSLDCH
jgi:uncharacterized coiled-coil DUF342 family protein